jgi:hypothetical protein
MESYAMKTLITVMALVFPCVAGATGNRVVILAPTGAQGVAAQLGDTLCVSEDCVAADRVLSAGKLDWAKVSRENVASVIVGHAVASKKGPEVELSVLAAGGKVKCSDRAPLNDDNKLAVKDLVTASAAVLEGIDSDGPSKDAAPAKAKALAAHHAHAKPLRHFAARTHTTHAHG